MPRPTSSNRKCCPKEMTACHARCRLIVCAAQKRCWHAMHDVVRLCVLSKGGDVMPRPTSFDCVCGLKAIMECHARRRSTICAAQR